MGGERFEDFAPLEVFRFVDWKGDDAVCVAMVIQQLLPDGLRGVVADWLAGARVEQRGVLCEPDFKIVTQFGDGADRGARGFDRVGLLNRNGGADIFDAVDLGAVEQVHELPRVGRERFDIAPLSFRMQGVKHQR